MLKWNEPIIYTAGKTWAAHGFKHMRAQGFNIQARWIDLDGVLLSPDHEFSPEVHEDEEYKRFIWEEGCKIDATACDLTVVRAMPEDGEKHSGSLVEIGHTTASDAYTGICKPVYIIGTCPSFEPVGHSDRAWKSQSIVFHYPNLSLIQGFQTAIAHYIINFERDYHLARERLQMLKKATG